jgi:hypothetical protein
MIVRFASQLQYASGELGRIRKDIRHADVAVLSAAIDRRERSAITRAYVYVWLAALLERVIRDGIRDALRELASHKVPSNELRASLFALLCDPEIASVSDRNRQSGWSTRVGLFARLLATEPAAFSEDIVPLDGRTLRAEHFDSIWVVFGLQGPSLPAPQHRVALKDLADGRNEVAHGHLEPVVFGKQKATADLLRLATRVEDVISHFMGAMDDYLGKAKYRR